MRQTIETHPEQILSSFWYDTIHSQVSQYSVWLRTARPDDRDSIPGRGKGFFL
jgi:hypothetical protein